MTDGKSSAELWRDHEAGDPRALAELVARVYDRLVGEIDRRLHSPRYARLRNRCSAEDVCNDIFARAMDRRKLVDFFENKNATFLSWLMGFIDGELGNRASRRHLSKEVSLDDRAEDAEGASVEKQWERALQSKDLRASEVSMKKEMAEWISSLIERLPEGQRLVVTLRHFVGLTFEEIAKMTGRPSAEAAWQAYSRAIAALRRGLEGGAAS